MRSKVREQARIDFDGAAYGQDFVLADVHMQWPLSRKEVTLFYSPDGLVVVAPLPDDQSSDRYRIVATVDQAPELPTSDYVQSVLDRRARPPTRDASTTSCGVHGFTSIIALRKVRARAGSCFAAMRLMCIAPRADRA